MKLLLSLLGKARPVRTLGLFLAAMASSGCFFQADDIDGRLACRATSDCLDGYECVDSLCIIRTAPPDVLVREDIRPIPDMGSDVAEVLRVASWDLSPRRLMAGEGRQNLVVTWVIQGTTAPLDHIYLCVDNDPHQCDSPTQCYHLESDADTMGSIVEEFTFPVAQRWTVFLVVDDKGSCAVSSNSISVDIFAPDEPDGGPLDLTDGPPDQSLDLTAEADGLADQSLDLTAEADGLADQSLDLAEADGPPDQAQDMAMDGEPDTFMDDLAADIAPDLSPADQGDDLSQDAQGDLDNSQDAMDLTGPQDLSPDSEQ